MFIINIYTRRGEKHEKKEEKEIFFMTHFGRFRSITFPINLESPFGFLGGGQMSRAI
jgi:hypothetical protein